MGRIEILEVAKKIANEFGVSNVSQAETTSSCYFTIDNTRVRIADHTGGKNWAVETWGYDKYIDCTPKFKSSVDKINYELHGLIPTHPFEGFKKLNHRRYGEVEVIRTWFKNECPMVDLSINSEVKGFYADVFTAI